MFRRALGPFVMLQRAHALLSCLEDLDRNLSLFWWDPTSTTAAAFTATTTTTTTTASKDDQEAQQPTQLQVPLYPMPAVYLPTGQGTNYTLNNVEPRNLQMALDLQLQSVNTAGTLLLCHVARLGHGTGGPGGNVDAGEPSSIIGGS